MKAQLMHKQPTKPYFLAINTYTNHWSGC